MDLASLKIDRDSAPKARRRRGRNPWPVRIGILAALGAATWLFWQPMSNWIDSVRLPQVQVARVVESHPASVGAVRGAAANGYIIAARRAALSADTPGRIIEIRVTEGSLVKEGEVVARLFSDEYSAALDRAKASLVSSEATVKSVTARLESARSEKASRASNREAAKSLVDDANAALDLATAQFERATGLFEQRISSQDDLDAAREKRDRAAAQVNVTKARLVAAEASVTDAEHRERVTEADLEVARAAVQVSRAEVDQASATLEKTFVRAPFDGIVVLKDAEVGEVVSPNSQGGSNARGSVCTMVDLDSLEVQADVQETSLSRVEVGAPANIYVDAYPDNVYAGRVDRIWPTADRQKATVEVRIAFEQRDETLRPDMGVRVVFRDGEQTEPEPNSDSTKSILVPEDCIVQIDGKSGAFVLERDAVRFAVVSLGERRSGRVTVERGLEAGQLIVRDPPSRLVSGDRVRVADG